MDDTVELNELDTTDLVTAIADRSYTCVEVMEHFLDRIESINPGINAIVSLRDRNDLIAEAHAADNDPHGGALHGIPFAIKNLVETAGIRTTHGSPIFANHIPTIDDLLAVRIRNAGAIIIGKTNTPEFGLGSQSFNPVHGVTRNPYDPDKTAGGSSGGAAAALAARLVPLADGSDMMGSLRNPAAYCNVYGFRPSYGRVPADPIGDMYLHQLATDGPMARSVRDLALLMDVIAVPDERLPQPWLSRRPFTERLSGPITGSRIGWIGDWNEYYPVESGILPLCEQALAVFARMGCVVEPVVPDFDPARLWQAWLSLRHFSIASNLRQHFDNPSERRLLKPEAIYEIENGLALSAADVQAASVIRSEWFRYLVSMFQHYDALVLPSAQVFPFEAAIHSPTEIVGRKMQTYHQWMEIVIPVSLVGLPALGLPVGFGKEGLPMGMQIFGKYGNDMNILQLGEAYHQATRWPQQRPPPVTGTA
ncbi:MAG: amidase [marine bacterium B5-7]|nr:MAG: amidase [marine bacterium B5-7]